MATFYNSTTSDTTTLSYYTWIAWNDAYSGTMTTAANSTWTHWNLVYVSAAGNASMTTTDMDGTWVQWNGAYWCQDQEVAVQPLTAEERAELARQEAAYARRLEEESRQLEQAAKEANARAEALLKENLNAEQRKEFGKTKTFTVITRDGQRRYRVNHGWSGNVQRLDEKGTPVESYCIHPKEQIPIPDHMLGQKLLIEHDEEHFLKTANKTRLA
jgi:hypothetical protein